MGTWKKSEFFKFFLERRRPIKKIKTPPGAWAAQAPAHEKKNSAGLRLPKKKLKKLGFALVNQLQLQVEVEDQLC